MLANYRPTPNGFGFSSWSASAATDSPPPRSGVSDSEANRPDRPFRWWPQFRRRSRLSRGVWFSVATGPRERGCSSRRKQRLIGMRRRSPWVGRNTGRLRLPAAPTQGNADDAPFRSAELRTAWLEATIRWPDRTSVSQHYQDPRKWRGRPVPRKAKKARTIWPGSG